MQAARRRKEWMQRGDVFELTLTAGEDGPVRARATWSRRTARGTLEPEFETLRASLASRFGAGSAGSAGSTDDADDAGDAEGATRGMVRRDQAPPTPTVRTTGEALFRSLPAEIRKLWDVARQTCAARGSRLLLQLRVDPSLAALPWELLCEPDGGAFVAASGETSLARVVEPTRPDQATESQADAPPLRVLVFAATPTDLEPLRVDDEVERILAAVADRSVRLERVAGGDRASLIEALQASRPDVLHWIGHGARDPSHGGLLLVESEHGTAETMRPDQLAELLRGGPKLVVLATCDSDRSADGDALHSVAPSLARAGVPAVVALRDVIRDDDAARFTQVLYESLATGDDIAAAVTMARRRLLLEEAHDDGSWAIPVLYQQDADVELSTQSFELRRPWSTGRRAATLFLAALALVAGGLALRHTLTSRTGSDAEPETARGLLADSAPGPGTTKGPTVAGDSASGPASETAADRSHDPRCPAAAGLDVPMVYLAAGSFDMGSTHGETDERPVHRVTLREPFCLGRFEITVGQWNAVQPDHAKDSDAALPATHVSWDDAMRFVGELNRRVADRPFRLPTEAEWEYAARAGTESPWSFGETPDELPLYGNCDPSSGHDGFDRTAPVGSLRPNPWGLFDVHGNVTEWVADRYGPYPDGAVVDPRGADAPEPSEMSAADGSEQRVRRGGNFRTREQNCTSSRRFASAPDRRIYTTGLRLAADPVAR